MILTNYRGGIELITRRSKVQILPKPGPQVEGIIEAAEKYSGKSARLNHARPPGASRVYNTRGVGGGIRNSNAIHSDLLFIMGTPELG